MERYFAICHPLESRKWQTVSHSYRIIALIWFFNSILMSPIAVLSQLLPTKIPGKINDCNKYNLIKEQTFVWFTCLFNASSPFFLI